MVPAHLRRTWRRRAALSVAAVLTLAAPACRKEQAEAGDPAAADAEHRAATAVRARYTSLDAVASAAWTWTGPTGIVYVLIDVQSAEEMVVQGRLDLWRVLGGEFAVVGRSAVMPSAASFGAFAFEDVTADGLPDFLGYVADSLETAYAVFLPGAVGAMVDELEIVAPGWRFATDAPDYPEVERGTAGPCALRLWAAAPTPDGQPEGWRYLELLLRGVPLRAPSVTVPSCARGAVR